MRIICASGDPGGARAIAPVATLAAMQGHNVYVISYGTVASDYLGQTVPWNWLDPASPEALLNQCNPHVLLFATSVKDMMALELAFYAQSQGVQTTHILDNWTNYSSRMLASDGRKLSPDLYLVMDDMAKKMAIQEGISPLSLRVTGTPALAQLTERSTVNCGNLIFVSEPVSQDQGRSPASLGFRGYTEDQVLIMLLKVLKKSTNGIPLQVILHPREDQTLLERVLEQHSSNLEVSMPTGSNKQKAISEARAVVGMSSILLYESWLVGLPCLSIQPDLIIQNFRYLEGRPGLRFVDTVRSLESEILELFEGPTYEHLAQAKEERARHHNASNNILKALTEYIRV